MPTLTASTQRGSFKKDVSGPAMGPFSLVLTYGPDGLWALRVRTGEHHRAIVVVAPEPWESWEGAVIEVDWAEENEEPRRFLHLCPVAVTPPDSRECPPPRRHLRRVRSRALKRALRALRPVSA